MESKLTFKSYDRSKWRFVFSLHNQTLMAIVLIIEHRMLSTLWAHSPISSNTYLHSICFELFISIVIYHSKYRHPIKGNDHIRPTKYMCYICELVGNEVSRLHIVLSNTYNLELRHVVTICCIPISYFFPSNKGQIGCLDIIEY